MDLGLPASRARRRLFAWTQKKAEAFKMEFDRANPAGTSIDAVNDWLRARALYAGPSHMNDFGTGDVLVELFEDKSPHWYCGSFDCL
jgi:hypothetical protein